jgi:hypothetical protein
VLLACTLAIVLFVRLRLLDFPLERDEGEYAYAGQLILDGLPPYKLAYNMKMPGIYLAYAGVMAIFGQTPAGIHLGLLVVHLASLVLFFLLAKRLFGLSGAALATSANALLTLSPVFYGLAAHATHFVVLPALLGIWMLFRFEKSRRWSDCLASGVPFGVAFLMKQPGLFFGLFGGLYLTWLCFREYSSPIASRVPIRRAFTVALRLGSFSVGCVLPFLAVCAWLKIAGVFPQFWFWTISYAREYATIFTPAQGWPYLRGMLESMFSTATLLCVAAALGLALLCTVRMELDRRVFLAGFCVFSLLAVCPGYYFRPHYFILFLPAVALLIGLAVEWGETWFEPTPWLRHLPLICGGLAGVASLLPYHEILFTLSPAEACRAVYPERPFLESLVIARHIEQNTKPNDRIAVIGSEPEIYFYAHRLSSTGYIYMYPLMEPQPFAKQMQADMVREIEQNPPSYLVFVSVRNSLSSVPTHYWESEPRHLLFDWVGGYVAKDMQLVGLIQLTGPQTTDTVWGTEAATTPLRSSRFILIFERHRY